jgi:hypothetical protein
MVDLYPVFEVILTDLFSPAVRMTSLFKELQAGVKNYISDIRLSSKNGCVPISKPGINRCTYLVSKFLRYLPYIVRCFGMFTNLLKDFIF